MTSPLYLGLIDDKTTGIPKMLAALAAPMAAASALFLEYVDF